MPSRRKLVLGAGVATAGIAGAGFWRSRSEQSHIEAQILLLNLSQDDLSAGRKLLSRVLAIDVHAHPGRSFIVNAENLGASLKLFTLGGAFEEESVKDMIVGGLSVASFAIVSDFQLLGVGDAGISATREFEAGEAWQSYKTQMARMHHLTNTGLVVPVLFPDDFIKVRKNNKLGGFFTAEGGDFLEGSLQHLDQAYEDGIRSITIVHYHVNEIGDIQTATPVHGGLSKFGSKLIRAMNEKGILIDLAHASRKTAIEAIETSEKPAMLSHTAIRGPGFDSARFIDLDLARLVTENGGLIGAWPAGIGLMSLGDYAEQIFRLVDLVGIDHVVLGTDMDANYKPVFDNYRQLPVLVAALLKKGLSEEDTSKFLGGNFLRVFREVSHMAAVH